MAEFETGTLKAAGSSPALSSNFCVLALNYVKYIFNTAFVLTC